MNAIFRYDWIVFIVVGTFAILAIRAGLHRNAVAAPGPLVLANLPWFISGIGKFFHPDRDIFDLFDLRLGIFAYTLVASVVAIWVSLLIWLFRGGAEQIAASPSVRRSLNLPENPSTIKLFAIAAVLGGVLGISTMVIVATEAVR